MKKKIELKNRFLFAASEHGKAFNNGDYKTANKYWKKLNALYQEAKENNEVDVFINLMNDKDQGVKIWASTFSLKFSPKQAKRSLKELSRANSLIGLGAQTTLTLWKEEKLELL